MDSLDAITSKVRMIVGKHGQLARHVDSVSDDASLSDAGMTSHSSVNVMLALEAIYGELPEEMLTRSVFHSISSIAQAMQALSQRG